MPTEPSYDKLLGSYAMKSPQRLSIEVKLWQNGEIPSLVTPRNSKNGFIKFDAVTMTSLTVTQSCAANMSPSSETQLAHL